MSAELIDILVRWGHLLFGITWIGMLYYFNFIQGWLFQRSLTGRSGRCQSQTGAKCAVVVPLGRDVHFYHRPLSASRCHRQQPAE